MSGSRIEVGIAPNLEVDVRPLFGSTELYLGRAAARIRVGDRLRTITSSAIERERCRAELVATAELIERICGAEEALKADWRPTPANWCGEATSAGEPRPRHDATGLAAATKRRDAIVAGMLEVVERHALVGAWRFPDFPVAVLPEHLRRKTRSRYKHILDRHELNLHAFQIRTGSLPVTIVSALCRSDGSEFTCGSATHLGVERSADKSIREAIGAQWTIRNGTCSGTIESPATSLEHLVRAFDNGGHILSRFYSQALAADSALTRQTQASSRRRIAAFESLGPVWIQELEPNRLGFANWFVVRVGAEGAFAKESDHARVDKGEVRRVATTLGLVGEPRWDPHPFG